MAAIDVADCRVLKKHEGDWETIKLITPATADSADTIDVTSIIGGRSWGSLQVFDQTTGDSGLGTVNTSTDVITLDASGGTTDHVYVVTFDVYN